MKSFLLFVTLAVTTLSFAQNPTAQFTAIPTSVCVGQIVTFTNQSTAGGAPIVSQVWNFGDGFSETTVNTTHAYNAPGVYNIILAVTDGNGNADTEVKNGYITVNPNPTASFTAATNGCTVPVGVTFTNTSTGGSTYSWNFGAGASPATSTIQNPPLVNYASAGTYTVTLITTNTFGCTATATQSLVVNNFSAGITAPATACQGQPVTINNNSTVGANAFNWSFPGGSPGSSSTANNSVTYNTPGTYTISLTAQNTTSGCSDNATQSITINPSPTPSFVATPSTGCAPQTVTFTNTSGAGTFVWDFGDGSPTFTGATPPPHIYATNGTFIPTVTMTNSNGCVGVASGFINLTAPFAAFSSDKVDGCAPLTVQFSDASVSSDPITSWVWNFGDGSPTFSGQTPPPHTYPVGTYDITLTITTSAGCMGTITINEYIKVGAIDLVDFTLATSPECIKTDIQFTNTSVISAPHTPDEVTYLWDFDVVDMGEGTSTMEDPTHMYTSDTGFFDVSLIVTFRGCKDTIIKTDIVYIKPPISRFSAAQSLFCNPASFPVTVTVNDNSIINSITPPQDAEMFWRWGDGSPDTQLDDPDFDDADKGTTSHNYTTYGSFTIKQVIYNYTTGCEDSTTTVIHISNIDAIVGPLAQDSVCVNSVYTFNESSTTFIGHPFTTFSWLTGDGNTVTGPNATYSYPAFGTYTTTLTVTNSVGCTDMATFAPITALALPQAALTPSDNAGCAPFPVTFTNNSTLLNNGVPLDSFIFSFSDDGSIQNTSNVATTVNHTFLSGGTFNVTLVAVDEFGCVSPPVSVPITLTKPTASFTMPAVVCDLQSFTATNSSTGTPVLSYEWYLDGVSGSPDATTNDYSLSFNEPNNSGVPSATHTITLITEDGNGCLDTQTQNIIVSTPIADVSYTFSGGATNANGDFVCPPVFATFTDSSNSIGTIASNTWVFGDGNGSLLPSPNNTYVFPGTYTAAYTIIDQYGCEDTVVLVDFLTIFGPSANPSWSIDPTMCGQDVTFDIGTTSLVTDIEWTLDDGTIVNDSTNFLHTYQNIGTYNAFLTVSDANGCDVVYPLNPIVIPDNGLDAFFSASPDSVNIGGVVVFDDQSTASSSSIVAWTWDLGVIDPFTNSNGNSVSQDYYTSGQIPIILTITDNFGCTDQYQYFLNVDADFEMPNVFTPNGDGLNDFFSFKYDVFTSFDITIVNRWGEIMTERLNQTGTIFWEGLSAKGDEASDGVYFYVFNGIFKDGTPVKKDGFVQLFRSKN